jgi:GT2 family glycosyltransferase
MGLGPNRNCALAQVTGDYILFLDDDCCLGETFLEKALDAMAGAERVTGSGRVIVSGSERNGERVVVAHEQTFLGFQRRPYGPDEPLKTIVINATLFPAALFARMSFDPQLRYGLDEVDVATRAAAAGFRIVNVSGAQNHHYPSPDGRAGNADAADTSRLYITTRRYLLVERRYARGLAFVLVAPTHLLLARVRRQGVKRGVRATARILVDVARSFQKAEARGGAIMPPAPRPR